MQQQHIPRQFSCSSMARTPGQCRYGAGKRTVPWRDEEILHIL